MTESASEPDATRVAIIAAMDRLLTGTPLRATGRLSVSQLAVEAGVKRWQLTHRHLDLKEKFQARVRTTVSQPAVSCRCGSDVPRLRAERAALLEQVADLEQRLRLYATVINTLAGENAALTSIPHANSGTRCRNWRKGALNCDNSACLRSNRTVSGAPFR
ncbi:MULTISPECIES: hypothetical protein [Nocardiaceae]|uniref:hypothetical protein n=1 Tax=Nocardiaceae TaxID=85025 RepID=UPI0011138359|nr:MULTISPECIES: hypothetical protein [Nocardiaceae]MBF6137838.1 hypothetical protein [Nocardia otitidiscaviarum]MBF6485361.1 hypothetical protein [Nocardia otitidiscaviarum]QNG19013.1 hypothetical protein G4H72_10100 [Rhodococcus triatomae]QNG25074.1 hypothetical protein G4H71_20280 [Rhodococcus triatomae]